MDIGVGISAFPKFHMTDSFGLDFFRGLIRASNRIIMVKKTFGLFQDVLSEMKDKDNMAGGAASY